MGRKKEVEQVFRISKCRLCGVILESEPLTDKPLYDPSPSIHKCSGKVIADNGQERKGQLCGISDFVGYRMVEGA